MLKLWILSIHYKNLNLQKDFVFHSLSTNSSNFPRLPALSNNTSKQAQCSPPYVHSECLDAKVLGEIYFLQFTHFDSLQRLEVTRIPIQFMLSVLVFHVHVLSQLGSLTKTGVSVIRVSGSNAFDAVRALTPSNHSFPTIRKATLRDIIDPNTKELIDKGLVLCFNQGAR